MLKIEGEKIEFKENYKFKSNEKYIKIKLIIKENVSEINMHKMFSNCFKLRSLNGISKLKKIKFITLVKCFIIVIL